MRVLGLVMVAGLACVPGLARAADVAGVIAAREAACNKAYAANDLKTYFGCYDPGMTGMFPDGRTDLASYRSDWTAMIKAGGHVDRFDFSDMKIQVAPGGRAAVASYQAQVQVTLGNGKLSDHGKYYETDVWFLTSSGWKLVESHYSKADHQ